MIADSKKLIFMETSAVNEHVSCDVYHFTNDVTKDLAVITIKTGGRTPLQKVLLGISTREIYVSGKGSLCIERANGQHEIYAYPGDKVDVEVYVGDVMQWFAEETLIFQEICEPPFSLTRFLNIDRIKDGH